MCGIHLLHLESVAPDFDALLVSVGVTVLPLLFGVFIKHCTSKFNRNTQRVFQPCRIDSLSTTMVLVSVLGFVAIISLYLANPYDRAFIFATRSRVWGCAIAQNVCGLLVGYMLSRSASLPAKFHRTLAFEVGAQVDLVAPKKRNSIIFSGRLSEHTNRDDDRHSRLPEPAPVKSHKEKHMQRNITFPCI